MTLYDAFELNQPDVRHTACFKFLLDCLGVSLRYYIESHIKT